jgi:mitochondrial fission protein ELM1
LKKRHPQTFIAFLKDPRFARDEFDFLWLPTHDRAQSDNMFKTATSPHGLSPAVLDEARAEAATRFPFQSKPRALVLLGGPTKGYDYTSALADRLSNMLTPSSHDYELMIVPSRRTPDAFIAALTAALGDAATYVWDRVSDNPYRQLMATADVIIAPGDSHNMASEALAPGAQVFVFEPEGTNRKLDYFRAELIKQGLAQIFTGLPSASALQKHAPYDATRLIADAMMESFNSRGAFHD